MNISKKILALALVLCLVNISLCQDTTSETTIKTPATTTPTTTSAPTTDSTTTKAQTTESTTTAQTTQSTTTKAQTTESTTTAQTTQSTTTKAQTTEPSTTTSQTTEPTTTKPQTTEQTTTAKETTQSSTTLPTTTTTAPPTDKVFNFTVPENTTEPTCLRAKFSLSFVIGYLAEFNKTQFNTTYKMNLEDYDSYSGTCNETLDTLEINFNNKTWSIMMSYTLKDNTYVLDTIALNYDTSNFANVTNGGKKSVMKSGLGAFSTSKGMSYKCTSMTEISLDNEVKVDFRNYQAQPFITDKTKDFDTAMECSADTTGTSKLVPIIVGSALAVLVILVLVAYVIGKHKHRTGYQQV